MRNMLVARNLHQNLNCSQLNLFELHNLIQNSMKFSRLLPPKIEVLILPFVQNNNFKFQANGVRNHSLFTILRCLAGHRKHRIYKWITHENNGYINSAWISKNNRDYTRVRYICVLRERERERERGWEENRRQKMHWGDPNTWEKERYVNCVSHTL